MKRALSETLLTIMRHLRESESEVEYYGLGLTEEPQETVATLYASQAIPGELAMNENRVDERQIS